MRNRRVPKELTLASICGFLVSVIASPLHVRATFARAHQGTAQFAQPAKFEVASVKPCVPGDVGFGGRGGGGNPPPQWSPGRLTVTCQSVRFFIASAYVEYADGESHPERGPMVADMSSLMTPIEGLPSWGNSERFTISAEVPGDAGKEMMMGPMMQSLLEDRFHLRIHVDNREVPAYDLIVAKGGLKLPQNEPVCRAIDANHPGQRLGPENLPNCTMQMRSLSMADFATLLRGPLGVNRPVIDRTELKGTFEIHMAWTINRDNLPQGGNLPDDASLPTIFDALKEQLGLELVPTKGIDRVLVVDHIEEPTPN